MIEEIKELFAFEAEAIRQIPVDENFEKTIDIIYHQVHEKGGKLIVSGMGKAGQIAQNIATTFSSTGTPALFLHPSDAQHGDLGVLAVNDVLLLVSNSGKTREIIELIELAENLYPEIPFVVITGNKECEISKKSKATIYTGNPNEVCPLGLTPSTSTTVMTVIGDALMVMMMKKIGFSCTDYAKRHHGGYLGQKSRQQAQK
ncbi:MAG TPA: SIS domain-containing protein [Prolixibacteraceae bacterium]|nr:SIS domain-containing protein [Prolixibacteraceae bacterium]